MNNFEFQRLLDEEKWTEAYRESTDFWTGSARRRYRLLYSMLLKTLESKK